jgi:DnaJ-class molecular chaperone
MTADDRPELCPACEQVLAAWVRREPDRTTCPECDGCGGVWCLSRGGRDVRGTCPTCKGTGYDPEPAESPCVVCSEPDCGHHGG